MTVSSSTMPPRLVVLRQVEGSQWCVVEHAVQNGKRQFAARIATARDYAPACQVAIGAAKRMRLPLAIEGAGLRLRPFAPQRDLPKNSDGKGF